MPLVHCPKRKILWIFKAFVIFVFLTSLSYLWHWENFEQLEAEVRNWSKSEDGRAGQFARSAVRRLQNVIAYRNNRFKILNLNKFGAVRPNDTVVVVQVHNRINYLKMLIESLRRAKDVQNIFLVFSHDLYDEGINNLIESIDFCKVLQVFYPYSLQLYPNSFPGPSEDDCPRDISKQDALERKCANFDSPDSYGHYREAQYTQTKHHWFWKMNFVFNALVKKWKHTGFVILLEEDHYVTEDIFYVLDKMVNIYYDQCRSCDFITLGAYNDKVKYSRESPLVQVQKWLSNKHNMGLTMNAATWSKIKTCAKSFCTYDDYNWDWSLQHISLKCLKSPLVTLNVVAPRVFHIGECGVHHKRKDCTRNQQLKKVERILTIYRSSLFPKSLTVGRGRRAFKMPKVNGGWGDKRDHVLCMHHLEF